MKPLALWLLNQRTKATGMEWFMKTHRLVVTRFDPFSNFSIARMHESTNATPGSLTGILVFTPSGDLV